MSAFVDRQLQFLLFHDELELSKSFINLNIPVEVCISNLSLGHSHYGFKAQSMIFGTAIRENHASARDAALRMTPIILLARKASRSHRSSCQRHANRLSCNMNS